MQIDPRNATLENINLVDWYLYVWQQNLDIRARESRIVCLPETRSLHVSSIQTTGQTEEKTLPDYIESDKDKYMVCVEYIYNRNHGALLERERFLLSIFDFIIIIRLRWHKSFLSRLTFSICGTLLVIFIDGLEKWRGRNWSRFAPRPFTKTWSALTQSRENEGVTP